MTPRWKNGGGRRQKAKQVLKLTKNSSNFLSTIQIGVTLAGFLTSAVAAQNFAVMLTDALAKTSVVKVIPVGAISVISTILITLVMSYFSLVLGELAPKKFAMQKSEKSPLQSLRYFSASVR